jgi:hypothetical protein
VDDRYGFGSNCCLIVCQHIYLVVQCYFVVGVKAKPSYNAIQVFVIFIISVSGTATSPLELVSLSRFGLPFVLESVHCCGVEPTTIVVGAGGDVSAFVSVTAGKIDLVSFLVDIGGGIVPVPLLVGIGVIIRATFSVGVLVPFRHPPSSRSIKSHHVFLTSCWYAIALNGGVVGGGSIKRLSEDKGGTGIPLSTCRTDGEMI